MKKLFVALAFIAAVSFMATPSMALVGSPDPVVATNILQPFFLVSFDGNLDTLVALTNTKSQGPVGTKRLFYHWTLLDKESNHRANGDLGFSTWDVISLSVRNDLLPLVSDDGLKALEVDLDGNGVNDHWMGYLTYDSLSLDPTKPSTIDPLMGQMYLLNLQAGLASGVILPGREYAPRPVTFDQWIHGGPGWWSVQNSYLGDEWLPPIGTLPFPNFTDYEVFTAFAYATSKARENGYDPHQPDANGNPTVLFPIPEYIRLVPRFFLLNESAETFFFLWTSGNWGRWEQNGQFEPDKYEKVVNVCNEDEVCYSGQINIPYELNFIDVRRILPSAWTSPIGGWVDIAWYFDTKQSPVSGWDYPWYYSAVPLAAEWLGYSYQYAQSPNGSLNWGALFDVHRDVGTFVEGLPLP
jgi:hypothetical protein